MESKLKLMPCPMGVGVGCCLFYIQSLTRANLSKISLQHHAFFFLYFLPLGVGGTTKLTIMKRFFLLLLAVAVGVFAKANNVFEALPKTCLSNQIIYITQYGYPLTLPNPDIVGETGANLMDNQYKDGIGRLIFDSDVKNIPNNMFSGSSSLVGVVLPPSVTSIGEKAFANCNNLTAISMLGEVCKIGEDAFIGCININDVNISDLHSWCCINFPTHDANPICAGSADIEGDFGPYPKLYCNNTEVSDVAISYLSNYTFADCVSLKSVTIKGDRVTSIERCAFGGCKNLTNITIPDSVTSIREYAFSGCESLTNISIPESVTSIEGSAFAYCSSMKSVVIPHGISTIEGSTFEGCYSLTNVQIPNSVTAIRPCAFRYCASLANILIPNGVTSIGWEAFRGCSHLKSVALPNSITSIDEGAFYGCDELEAFYGKFSSSDNRCLIVDGKLVSFAQCGLTEYTVPDGVTMVEWGIFSYTLLTKIVFPTSVTSLGRWMFSDSYQLKELYFMSTTPPAGNNTMFDRTDPNLKIYVPRESVDAYKNAPYWCDKASQIFGYDF